MRCTSSKSSAGAVVHIRDVLTENRDLAEGVVYIGDRMPPFMSPTGKYLPRSIWHNPFNGAYRRGEISREESLRRFREYMLGRPDLLDQLPELEGKILACWCKPDACHGDVLLELLQERGF
jgi:hypothetical protein